MCNDRNGRMSPVKTSRSLPRFFLSGFLVLSACHLREVRYKGAMVISSKGWTLSLSGLEGRVGDPITQ